MSKDLRQQFLDFFQSHQHRIVRSSPLVPADDPTLLFTNAGMNQFKDIFLGNAASDYKRAVTCQKVMRAGGKHNDLENVGRTARHHTFFEMLGNFSFGDYFKSEAVRLAWEFLTVNMGLSADKLAVSVYEKDDEAFDIWHKEIGIPQNKIARLGEKDNFWSMGDTGPCGPCSEIHYDLYGNNGKTPTQSLMDDDGRFLEIWNLVFMQFEKKPGEPMVSLPNPSIDTGMGLERIASVVEGVKSNYDTSLFKPLLGRIASSASYSYGSDAEKDVSCKVIADHLRAMSFLIADGVMPGSEGRGYVMKRILRRAARHALALGGKPGFLADLSGAVVELMGTAYPELVSTEKLIADVLRAEEVRFSGTLVHGMKHLEGLTKGAGQNSQIDGKEIFKLYDTFGFPVDLARDILEDKGLSFGEQDFDSAMENQRTMARKAQEGTRENKKVSPIYREFMDKHSTLSFSGYNSTETKTSVVAFIKDGKLVDSVSAGDEFEVLLDNTPFYAEGGGQVGDSGWIENEGFRIRVSDTFKPFTGMHVSKAKLVSAAEGKVSLSDAHGVKANVDASRRRDTARHHTATHLLHNGLRGILGEHVKQAGSHVNESRLRFDFTHFSPVGPELIAEIESYVNGLIRENFRVSIEEQDLEAAINSGAMAFFTENYGDRVRVVSAGPSVELCGGCHAGATGELGLFKIISEESVASGVRRIEAYAGEQAFNWASRQITLLNSLGSALKTLPENLPDRLTELEEENKKLKKQIKDSRGQDFLDALKSGGFAGSGSGLMIYRAAGAEDLNELGTLFGKEGAPNAAAVIHATGEGRIDLLLAVGSELKAKLDAGKTVQELAPLIAGRGGGKSDSARCGGTRPEGLQGFIDGIKKKLG